MSTQKKLMSNWRWWLCSLLFVATTVNYLDRQVLSLTYKEFIAPEFGWNDNDYGTITGFFSIFYAIACLFAGKFVDWMGTKKGYLISIFVWSTGAVMHAGCGIATTWFVDGVDSVSALRAVEAGSTIAVTISSVSVWLFLLCRGILALGEAGNFPAAIKTTAEYFPKKDRAFATSIFNAGASVGALVAPLTIPVLAKHFGWEWAFIIIGGLGYLWMILWQLMYDKPEKSKHVNKAELEYIHQDDAAETAAAPKPAEEEKSIPFMKCFKFKQTWAFVAGKFFTDGVWWFFLFWAPAFFQDQFGAAASSGKGQLLIFTLYAIVTVVSIFGGYLPRIFVDKRGMNPYNGRMLAMLIFAFFPLVALAAQPLGMSTGNPWWPAILIGIAGAAHQAWSANIFSTVGDMFPKSTIASITGIGAMAGGIGGFIINKGAGALFTRFAGSFSFGGGKPVEISIDKINGLIGNADNHLESIAQLAPGSSVETMIAKVNEIGGSVVQEPLSWMGMDGKPASYFIVFCFCGIAYLVAWSIMKSLVPKYKPIEV